MRDKHYVGIVDFTEDEDEEKVRLCRHCQDYGVESKLGPRTWQGDMKDLPADWDLFMQCHTCGTVYGFYEVKTEQAVSGFAEATDNPFDDGKEVLGAFPRRNTKEGKKAMAKKQRERLRPHHKDLEIDQLLRIYGEENVHVIYDSDP